MQFIHLILKLCSFTGFEVYGIKSVTAFHSLRLPLDPKLNTSKHLWGVKTRNAKPPRVLSKGRLFYLQVENLCQFKSIFTSRNTLGLGEKVRKKKSRSGDAWVTVLIFGTLSSQLCGAGAAVTAQV